MDDRLFETVHRFAGATPWLHTAADGYASYGAAVFAVLILAGWWIARRSSDPARLLGPDVPVWPRLVVLAHRSTDFSFPSDHATMAGAAALGLLLVSRRLGLVAVLAALAMAAARVYVGAHYPGDVAAGLLLGGLVAALLYAACRTALARLVIAAGRTRLRPLLAPGPQPAGEAP